MNTNKAPNFFIAGFPKCGTSTLWQEFQNHPDIFMPRLKEPQFFSENFKKGWEWYYSLFDDAQAQKAIGEASTSYAHFYMYPKVPERIFECFPDSRLIFIVRHPISRMESAWKQNVVTGRLPSSQFDDSVRKYLPIVAASKYFENIQGYRSYFCEKQILIIFLEDLKKHRKQVLNKCFRFLDIEPLASKLKSQIPQNISAKKQIPTSGFKIIQRLTILERSKNLAPDFIKRSIRNYLTMSIPTPEWNKKTLAWAIEEVKQDAKSLLNYAGKPDNFWQFSDSAISSVIKGKIK